MILLDKRERAAQAARMKIPALLLLLASSAMLSAQDLQRAQTELEQEYKGKVLLLRNFYSGDYLRYEGSGHLKGKAKSGPWTLSGKIQIEEVKLRRERLELSGFRIYMHYIPENKQFRHIRSWERIEIEAQLPGGEPLASARTLMRTIFLRPDERLADNVPDHWRAFLEGEVKPTTRNPTDEIIKKFSPVGGGKLKRRADPVYRAEAKRAGIAGTVILNGMIEKDGTVREIRIERPVGGGLDEAAIESVQKWRYEPYTLDGKTVSVATTITVNFRLAE